MSKEKVKLWTNQYLIIIILSSVMFASFYMITAGFPIFVSTISDNPAIAGIMTTTLMTASLITRFFASVIIQKVNMKLLLIISLVYFLGTIALTFINDSIGFLIFIRALQGIGFSMLTILVFTISSNIVPKSRLGEGIVFFAMSTSVGTTMGPLIAIAYLANYSFRSMMMLTLGLMSFAFVCSFFVKNTVKNEKESPQPTNKEPFYKYMFDKRVLLPCILVALNYMAIAGTVNFIGAFGKEIDVGGRISQFFIAQAIAMIIVRVFSGKIFDKFGHRILIIPGAISGTVGLILLGFSTGMGMVWISGALFGIAYAIIHPIIQAWALTLVPPEKKATANSMLLIFIDFGLAIGSLGLGILAKSVGYGMTFSFSAAFMIVILLLYLFGSNKTKAFDVGHEKSETTRRN
ncbi:Predicted arabinose efflux permease, MFS family [Psychrobacillus sp. OK028]|uniref:MFS transporter n=1 Tax=Psychrobacillus sp. OK028 TaxID=1884359 RepID=UPI00088AF575|nr:MFS transporter [Psychrobacillus sp. OK028]SDN02231.1 Predicted arabinose efflux permease, MFS family [Psychrobacillus sp. OK028]